MPGVPSGRGCEACRKQKKKCDQAKPRCGRCARLEIDCVGARQRRFKFIEESQSVVVRPKPVSSSLERRPATFQRITWAPSNESTMVMSAFCSALSIRDARYDLSVYGTFMGEIPSRIGTNAALDASVRATTSVYRAVQTRSQTVESLEDYGKALSILVRTLNDPKQARTANTLCAMYLMMVCQGWVGQKGDCTGHGQAFAYILSNVETENIQDGFENELLVTLCVPVIVESIGNSKIQLFPWLKKLTDQRDNETPFETLKLQNLARLSDFIDHPELNLGQMRFIYQSAREEIIKIRDFLEKILGADVPDKAMHSRYQTVCSIQLAFAILLNTQLRSFGNDDVATLLNEATALALEAITLAEDAMQYRPLGASGIPMCLVCAWAGTKEMLLRLRIEEILADYQQDFATVKWMETSEWLEKKLRTGGPTKCLPELQSLDMDLNRPTAVDAQCSVM